MSTLDEKLERQAPGSGGRAQCTLTQLLARFGRVTKVGPDRYHKETMSGQTEVWREIRREGNKICLEQE